MPVRVRGFRALVLASVAVGVLTLFGRPALAQPDDDDADEAKAPMTEIVVTARRLDAARAAVELSLGASTYSVSNDVVENRPGGESANLVHVLLQMPGVVQSAAGELRVRAQANLQYRINNIIVPEGYSDLADTLRARFADNVQLVTGALPAQYGLQTGGVINITTKNGVYEHGGEVEAYGGTRGHAETAFEVAGSAGATNYYASASYLHNDVGLGSLDGSATPPHDRTDQADAFAFLDHIIDDQSRASLILGLSSDWNQLPRFSGAGPTTALPAEALVDLGGAQRNQTAYALASYQHTSGRLTLQAAVSVRYGLLQISSDQPTSGISEALRNRAAGGGLQFEGVYDAGAGHKLRTGVVTTFVRETSKAQFASPLGDADELPAFAGTTDRRTETSLFVEDEWRPLDPLTINYGLRFDDVTGPGGGTAVGPRLSAVWRVASATTLHLGYARYMTPAPQAEEAGFEGSARAETDNYYDVGVEQSFDELKLGLDAYWRDAANLLDEVRVGATALRRPFNFADGRVRGVELSAIYAEGPFSAWGNLGVAQAEGRRISSNQAMFTAAELAGAAAGFIPVNSDQRVTASFGSSYHWRALRISADAIYGGGLPRTVVQSAPNGARLPDYIQVNMSLVYRLDGLGDRPLDLRLDATNLFDARYQLQDGTSLARGLPDWGPRRGFVLGLEQQF